MTSGMTTGWDVVLIQPPLRRNERYGRRYVGGDFVAPIGLAYLAAILRSKGWAVSIIDAQALEWDTEQTLNELKTKKPAYVGISAVTISVLRAIQMARAIKNRIGDIPVLLGGPHVTALPEKTLREAEGFVDAVVIGEGEETLPELLSAMKNGGALDEIKGIAFLRNGEFIKTPARPFIKNLDDLPMPAWDLLPDLASRYRASIMGYRRLPSASVVFSRGCPGMCIFCDNSVFGRRSRIHSATYAFEILNELRNRYGIREVEIRDENFLVHRDQVKELCRLIVDKKFDITWSCNARVDAVDRELLAEIRRAGCWQVAYGIESGSQKILDFDKKNITLEQVEQAVAMTVEAGLDARGFFMIGHPLETEETMQQTINFLNKLKLNCFHVTFFTPLPGSPIYPTAAQYGTFDRSFEKLTYWNKVFIPHGLTPELMDKYERKMYTSFYLKPRVIFHYLSRINEPAYLLKLFKAGYTFLKIAFGDEHQ